MPNLRTYRTKSEYQVLIKEWKSPQQMTCLVTSLHLQKMLYFLVTDLQIYYSALTPKLGIFTFKC